MLRGDECMCMCVCICVCETGGEKWGKLLRRAQNVYFSVLCVRAESRLFFQRRKESRHGEISRRRAIESRFHIVCLFPARWVRLKPSFEPPLPSNSLITRDRVAVDTLFFFFFLFSFLHRYFNWLCSRIVEVPPVEFLLLRGEKRYGAFADSRSGLERRAFQFSCRSDILRRGFVQIKWNFRVRGFASLDRSRLSFSLLQEVIFY